MSSSVLVSPGQLQLSTMSTWKIWPVVWTGQDTCVVNSMSTLAGMWHFFIQLFVHRDRDMIKTVNHSSSSLIQLLHCVSAWDTLYSYSVLVPVLLFSSCCWDVCPSSVVVSWVDPERRRFQPASCSFAFGSSMSPCHPLKLMALWMASKQTNTINDYYSCYIQ